MMKTGQALELDNSQREIYTFLFCKKAVQILSLRSFFSFRAGIKGF
ncbi:hypothetical protein [Mesobacillus subterraneus]|nr:hypothetical protein [Mesobacillus subterraneus]